ncbi:MAG: hypothetical protein ACD_58C00273G0008 [uncultured bacterium]|nr:MAG: hypothetical protein ACD_58C00273G0008 [uncultured bacterium]
MKIKCEKLPKSKVKLEIEVLKEDLTKYFDEAYKKLSHQVNIKGFREGKAPKLMVIESVGLNRYNSTALDIALPQIYYQAVKDEKLVPICQPQVNIKQFGENENFIFDAEVDLMPEIKLGEYKKLKITLVPSSSRGKNQKLKINSEVTKEEIEKIIKRLRYQSAKFTGVDRGAKEGDNIEIDFDGSVKGVKRDNLQSKNYPLILGEKVLVPGFEDELVDMKKGEEKEFNLEVKSSAGKEKVDFKVKMNAVRDVELPELDENFSKKFGHDSVDKLISAIGESIKVEKEQTYRAQLEHEILEQISEKSKLDVPESLIEQEVSRKITQMQQQMGAVWQQYLDKMGKTIEDLRKEIAPGAEKQVKFGLLLGEIARDMGLLKESAKTQQEQEKIVKETMDKLIEMATK